MYRCEICGNQVPPRQKRQLIVIKEPYRHPYRFDAWKAWVYNGKKWKQDWVDDCGGTGTRIVREISVCVSCKAGSEPCTG